MQYEAAAVLPEPDTASKDHSERVRAHIARKISAAGGQLSFAEYLQEALYAPGLGYYSAGTTKFGKDGDFVTAPEVSPVFGQVLAGQVSEVLAAGAPDDVLEIGAGSGRLAATLLPALDQFGSLPAAYSILEVSPDLTDRQRALLAEEVPQFVERVRWVRELPQGFTGAIIANEVLDALPFERFALRSDGVQQCCVSLQNESLVASERPAPQRLRRAVAELEADLGEPLAAGYISEYAAAAPAWIADLANSLARGAIFLFDYGVSRREYYAPDRTGGWLRCHFRHHAHSDPFIYPGIQDLTSWVDFSLIASAACDAGLDILGYQTQAEFLLGGGLERVMDGFQDLPVARQLQLSGEIKTLTLPGEMGESFKLMVLGRGDVATPSALNFADRTRTL